MGVGEGVGRWLFFCLCFNRVPQTHTPLGKNIWVTLAKVARLHDALALLWLRTHSQCGLICVSLTAHELQHLCKSTPAPVACMATGFWQQLSCLRKSPALPSEELWTWGTLSADSHTTFKFISTRNSPITWWANDTIVLKCFTLV